jgi:hypothetical protein
VSQLRNLFGPDGKRGMIEPASLVRHQAAAEFYDQPFGFA